jgi:hypothetical protein
MEIKKCEIRLTKTRKRVERKVDRERERKRERVNGRREKGERE